jgi:hypothetical protein
MKLTLSTFSIGIALLVWGQAEAASLKDVDCVARQSQVTVKLSAQQELDIEGRKFTYGVFVLSNRSKETISVFADVYKLKYWVVHPHSIVVQRKEGNSWVDAFTTLSEYSGPDRKYAIPSNKEWKFFQSIDELVINRVSRDQEFRVVLTDTDHCDIPSEPFTLESLVKPDQAR